MEKPPVNHSPVVSNEIKNLCDTHIEILPFLVAYSNCIGTVNMVVSTLTDKSWCRRLRIGSVVNLDRQVPA